MVLGGVPFLATFAQASTAFLSTVCVTTSQSFKQILNERGVKHCSRWYRPVSVRQIVHNAMAVDDDIITGMRSKLTNGQPDRTLVVYVGRWAQEKRLHVLVKALPEGITLAFVGDGPMSEEVLIPSR